MQFECSQPTDSRFYPVSEKDEFLSFFSSFIQQDLLDKDDEQISLGQVLTHLAPFPNLPSEQKDALKETRLPSLVKASAGKTPQPTPALSWLTISERDRCNAKDNNGKLLLLEHDTMAYLEVVYIIPHLLKLFGNFEIAFKPVSTLPHTYKVDYVELDCMEPASPQLLAIHSAIGRILHLSAAGEYINDYIRDLEEMKGGEVMQNGSTRLDDYVRFRLSEMSVY
ncbi:hypothetical protein BDW60DRAFT_213948 [Aspergillus nidulans var. acristatus]